jgi:hypothetical protein
MGRARSTLGMPGGGAAGTPSPPGWSHTSPRGRKDGPAPGAEGSGRASPAQYRRAARTTAVAWALFTAWARIAGRRLRVRS